MVWSPQVGSNRSLTVAARIRARFGAATVRERSISLMPFYLPVQRPAGAVRAFEIVVGLGRIGHAPGGRVVGYLLTHAVRHQPEKHLLHHGSGVIEVAMCLAAGTMGDAVALAFAGIEPFRLEDVGAAQWTGVWSGRQDALHVGIRQAQRGGKAVLQYLDHREATGAGVGDGISAETSRQRLASAASRGRAGGTRRRLRHLAGAADQWQCLPPRAPLIVSHIPVIVVRYDQPAGEIGEDTAFGALEDSAVAHTRKIDVTLGRRRLQSTLIPDYRHWPAPTVGRMIEGHLELHGADIGIVLIADVAIHFDARRRAGVDGVPQ